MTNFHDFKKNSMNSSLISNPFSINNNINEALEHLQMEYVHFQYASNLKEKFNNFSLLCFYKSSSQKKYTSICKYTQFSWHHCFGSKIFMWESILQDEVYKVHYEILNYSHLESLLRVSSCLIIWILFMRSSAKSYIDIL